MAKKEERAATNWSRIPRAVWKRVERELRLDREEFGVARSYRGVSPLVVVLLIEALDARDAKRKAGKHVAA